MLIWMIYEKRTYSSHIYVIETMIHEKFYSVLFCLVPEIMFCELWFLIVRCFYINISTVRRCFWTLSRFQTVRKNGASELFVKVIHSDFQHGDTYGWTLLCPTITMNNWMPDKPDDTLFYENVWQVDKDGFDKCRVIWIFYRWDVKKCTGIFIVISVNSVR